MGRLPMASIVTSRQIFIGSSLHVDRPCLVRKKSWADYAAVNTAIYAAH